VLALLGSVLGSVSVAMPSGRGGAAITQGVTLLQVFGHMGLAFSITLILSVVARIFSRPRS
jgi:hypothetical protein